MEKEIFLAKNINEFYSEGINALKRNSHNSATSLFFKALAVLADWIILTKEGFIPKNHSERFRILEKKYLEVYHILDKDFPAYQDSYSISLNKSMAEVIKNDVERIAKMCKFKLG